MLRLSASKSLGEFVKNADGWAAPQNYGSESPGRWVRGAQESMFNNLRVTEA